MPDQAEVVVTNTTPLLALTAAMGNLEILRAIYAKVVVPYEVVQEVKAGGKESFGAWILREIWVYPNKLYGIISNEI